MNRKNSIENQKLEKEINVLSEEISRAWILLESFNALRLHSGLNIDVYSEYSYFFYTVYTSFYNEFIYSVSRLHDSSKDSLSIVKLLRRCVACNPTVQEEEILDSIAKNSTGKKIKEIRDKLGRAHLDSKVSSNLEKQKRILKECTIELVELQKYLKLLTEALETVSLRLSKPLLLLRPHDYIAHDIRRLFEKLNKEIKEK